MEKKPIHYNECGQNPQSSFLADHLDGNRQEDLYGVPMVGRFATLTAEAFTQHAPDTSIQLRHMQSPTEKTNAIYFIYGETDTHFELVSVVVGKSRTHARPGVDYIRIPKEHGQTWIQTLRTDPIRETFHTELLDKLVATFRDEQKAIEICIL